MDQSLHIDFVERHENSKPDDRADTAFKSLADTVAHVITFEPRLDIPRSLVGAALGQGTMHSQFVPVARLVALALQHRLDRSVYQKIRVTPDRRSEMRVRLVCKSEMADIVGTVNSLPQ